jgi:hypothetical protein
MPDDDNVIPLVPLPNLDRPMDPVPIVEMLRRLEQEPEISTTPEGLPIAVEFVIATYVVIRFELRGERKGCALVYLLINERTRALIGHYRGTSSESLDELEKVTRFALQQVRHLGINIIRATRVVEAPRG